MSKHILPQNEVTIQGKVYKIVEVDGHIFTSSGPALGLNEPDLGTIKLNVSTDISLHSLKDTMLHECIHILDHGCQIGLKEKQVHRLASSIIDMMWSNPALAAWVCQRDWVKREEKPTRRRPKKKRAPRKTKRPMGFIDATTTKVLPANPSIPDLPSPPHT